MKTGNSEARKETQVNTITELNAKTQVNVIIRLVCIDRYSGFKYRRSSELRGRAGTGIGVRGEERVWSSGGGAIVRT